MKVFYLIRSGHFFLLSTLIAIVLIFSGCQDEINETTEPPPEAAFDNTSTVADLVQRTSQKDGSSDNIIDHSSCLTVKLPVTVVVNGIELLIESEDDFVEIEKILDASSDDTDVLEIRFPITVILPDHDEETVNSQEELSELSQECIEDGLDEDIECIDFVYPLSFSIFNSENQVASAVEVFNDEELYVFLDQLEEGEFVSLNFPVTLLLYNEDEVVVNDNIELEEVIESVSDVCDEDDDNDFDEDDVDDTEFINILLSQNWKIDYFFTTEDRTPEFENYILEFKENESILAFLQEEWILGEWESYGDGGYIELDIDFENDAVLENISEEWEVTEYSNETISLTFELDDDIEATLILVTSEDQTPDFVPISDIISEGSWRINKFVNNDIDETSNYASSTFTFSLDMTVAVILEEQEFTGSWQEVLEGEEYQLILQFDTSTSLDELNEDWYIIEYSSDSIVLRNSPAGEEADDELIFEKI